MLFFSLWFTHFSTYPRPLNIGGSQVSLFELILFSVYTYSLGELSKSHVLKTVALLLIAKFIGPRIISLTPVVRWASPFWCLVSITNPVYTETKLLIFIPKTAPPHIPLISGNDNAVNQNSYSSQRPWCWPGHLSFSHIPCTISQEAPEALLSEYTLHLIFSHLLHCYHSEQIQSLLLQ